MLASRRSNDDECPAAVRNTFNERASNKSFQKWRYHLEDFVRNARAEILLLFHCFWVTVVSLIKQNYVLDRACRINLNITEATCDSVARNQVENFTQVVDATQVVVANINSWTVIAENVMPIVLSLFVGSWSDRHGRKMFILLPLVGQMVSYVLLAASTQFPEWSAQVITLTYLIPTTIFGGETILMLCLNSYVADTTTLENRTFRIGTLNVGWGISGTFGMFVAGHLYGLIGYFWLYVTAAVAGCLSLIFALFFIRDVLDKSEATLNRRSNCFTDFFDPTNVLDSLTVFRPREGNKRLQLILLLFVVVWGAFPAYAYSNLMYLYTRKQLNWDEIHYGYYNMYVMFMMVVGSFIAMWIFLRICKFSDALIGIIASLSNTGAHTVYAFAVYDWLMYFGPVVDFVSGATMFIGRSMPTKLVERDEIGKVNSMLGILSGLTPMITGPLYNQLYASTISVFPGAIWILSSLVTMLAVAEYTWFYFNDKKTEKSIVSMENGTVIKTNETAGENDDVGRETPIIDTTV